MSKIEALEVINGYAWYEEETKELVWAYQEELQDVKPEDRPEGCTPVVIEVYPVDEWVTKKQQAQEYLGDISEQLSRFKEELHKVKKEIKIGDLDG